jgi:hypothetical protein
MRVYPIIPFNCGKGHDNTRETLSSWHKIHASLQRRPAEHNVNFNYVCLEYEISDERIQ